MNAIPETGVSKYPELSALPATPAGRLRVKRIPSLDGVRAFAVSSVMYSHAIDDPAIQTPWLSETLAGEMLGRSGRYGVLCFFVLSGYLICTLLLREYAKKGTISLLNFWYRRVLRIFPVFYLFIAVVGLITATGGLDIASDGFLAAGTYLWNYRFIFGDPASTGADSAVLGHLWSLAVEEQFYLLFPPALLLMGPRRIFWVCGTLVAASPLIRVFQYAAFPSVRDFGSTMGHTMFGASIAVGCLWALAEDRGRWRAFRERCECFPVFCGAVAVAVLSLALDVTFGGKWFLPAGDLVASCCFMLMIVYVVAHAEDSAFGRLLNSRPLVALGVLSYSLYIWQQLFFVGVSLPGMPILLERFLLGVLALVAAALSYTLVEAPILRYRDVGR